MDQIAQKDELVTFLRDVAPDHEVTSDDFVRAFLEYVRRHRPQVSIEARGRVVAVRGPFDAFGVVLGPLPKADPEGFDEFWAAYPRKLAKSTARRAFIARLREGVSAPDLVVAATNYARYCRNTEQRFIKHAATFIGPDRHYEDYAKGLPVETLPAHDEWLNQL